MTDGPAVQRVLYALAAQGKHPKRVGEVYKARCPAHSDERPSLEVSQGEKGALIVCRSVGCSADDIVAALGLTMADLFDQKQLGNGGGEIVATYDYVDEQLELLYQVVRFFPKGFAQRRPAVKSGEWEWKLGDTRRVPYRLPEIIAEPENGGLVCVVEGEKDADGLVNLELCATTIAGGSGAKTPDGFAAYFAGKNVAVIPDNDAPGEAFAEKVAAALSGTAASVKVVSLPGVKDGGDISDWLGDGGSKDALLALVKDAEKWLPLTATEPVTGPGEQNPDQLYLAGQEILEAEDVLALVRPMLADLGYAGPTEAAELVYLALFSRHLERPVNLMLEGQSAAGKSFTVDTAIRLHPPESVHNLTGLSERALVYGERDFEHRYVFIAEAPAMAEDGVGASLIRALAWGKGIEYETVIKQVAVTLKKKGPTGLITTSTKALEPEITTRLLAVPIADDRTLTQAIIARQCLEAAGEGVAEPDPTPWIAAARWLEVAGERRAVIPFAGKIAEVVPCGDVRLRRDIAQILSLIKTHALLHQMNRERDEQGRIVATPTDYDAIRRLLGSVLASTVSDASDTDRETVTAVAELIGDYLSGVPIAPLAEQLGVNRSSAFRRAKSAISKGYLIDNEDRPGQGRPIRLVVGDPLPGEQEILPALSLDENACTSAPHRSNTVTHNDLPVCNAPVQPIRSGEDSPTTTPIDSYTRADYDWTDDDEDIEPEDLF